MIKPPDLQVPVDPAQPPPAVRVGGPEIRLRGPVPACVVMLVAAVLLWCLGLWHANPRAMTDLGLMSLLGWPAVVALLLLAVSFFYGLSRRASDLLLGAHLATFIVLIHGTPAALFGTLRYSYAWKHLGIIDYIVRHGGVDTTINSLGVYHDWPGFFAGSAILSDLAGGHMIGIAMWATVFFELANLLALRFLFRSVPVERTHMWLALLFFFITTWVGQDYFSPQAFAYVLFLVLVGVVLRCYRRTQPDGRPTLRGWRLLGPTVLAAGLMYAISSSHQITPMAVFLTLTVLVLARRIRGWYLPVIAMVTMAGWAFTVAAPFTLANLRDQIAQLDNPLGNATGTLAQSAMISGDQHLVSLAGRAVIVIIVAFAVVGVIRLVRRGKLDMTMLLLALTPGLLSFLTSYDGELLFRVFLFASPFLSYFAAAALVLGWQTVHRRRSWIPAVPALLLTIVLLTGFLFAYYGKDQENYFTSGEVAAGEWIADHSVPGTLLVRGNTNYPRDFRNYEYDREVDISAEPDWSRILANPVGVLSTWLSDPRNTRAFVLITRSQEISNDTVGPMPPGALQRLESVLRASPLFTVVYSNRDAAVFALAVKP